MTYGISFSGQKEGMTVEEQSALFDKVEAAGAAAKAAIVEALGDDADTLTWASVSTDHSRKNLLAATAAETPATDTATDADRTDAPDPTPGDSS